MERIYNVPLRREFSKVPCYKKAKKAVTGLRAFLVKHMKSEDIRIDAALNEYMWKHGMKNPPHHVKLKAVKDEKTNIVTAYLMDQEIFTNKVLRRHNKYTISDKKPVEDNKKTESVAKTETEKKATVKKTSTEKKATVKKATTTETKKTTAKKAVVKTETKKVEAKTETKKVDKK